MSVYSNNAQWKNFSWTGDGADCTACPNGYDNDDGGTCEAVACVSTAKANGFTTLPGTDYSGTHLPNGPHGDFTTQEECGELCVNTPACEQWTYVPDHNNCWLSSGAGVHEPTGDARSSGIKLGNLTGVTGDTQTVTCLDNYEGGGTWTCGANGLNAGAWSGAADCIECAAGYATSGGAACEQFSCPDHTVPNATSATRDLDSADGKAGETTNVVCDPGYTGGGDWTCAANSDHTAGKWDGPACEANTCIATSIPNSDVSVSVTATTGKSVSADCNAGYENGQFIAYTGAGLPSNCGTTEGDTRSGSWTGDCDSLITLVEADFLTAPSGGGAYKCLFSLKINDKSAGSAVIAKAVVWGNTGTTYSGGTNAGWGEIHISADDFNEVDKVQTFQSGIATVPAGEAMHCKLNLDGGLGDSEITIVSAQMIDVNATGDTVTLTCDAATGKMVGNKCAPKACSERIFTNADQDLNGYYGDDTVSVACHAGRGGGVDWSCGTDGAFSSTSPNKHCPECIAGTNFNDGTNGPGELCTPVDTCGAGQGVSTIYDAPSTDDLTGVHNCNTNGCHEGGAKVGDNWTCTAANCGNHMTYGPYQAAPAGSYQCEFDLALSNTDSWSGNVASSTDQVTGLDAFLAGAGGGLVPGSATNLQVKDFGAFDVVKTFVISFSKSNANDIECRVLTGNSVNGGNGTLAAGLTLTHLRTRINTLATTTSDVTCANCSAGTTWNGSADSTSSCAQATVCGVGSGASVAADADNDSTCAPCGSGTFSDGSSTTAACAAHSATCGSGQGSGRRFTSFSTDNWEAVSGTWNLSSGGVDTLEETSNNEHTWAYYKTSDGVPDIEDVVVTTWFSNHDNDYIGIAVRYDESTGAGYLLKFENDGAANVTFENMTSGSGAWPNLEYCDATGCENSDNLTGIDAVPGPLLVQGQNHEVTLSFVGDTYKVILDGRLVFEGDDSTHSSGTVALYSGYNGDAGAGARWHDITIAGATATASADTVCTNCDDYTYNDATDASICGIIGTCAPGYGQTGAAPSASVNRTCGACTGDTYSNGNSGQACQSRTICSAGDYVVGDGNASANRTCGECTGTSSYSSDTNAGSCATCGANTHANDDNTGCDTNVCTGCIGGTGTTGTACATHGGTTCATCNQDFAYNGGVCTACENGYANEADNTDACDAVACTNETVANGFAHTWGWKITGDDISGETGINLHITGVDGMRACAKRCQDYSGCTHWSWIYTGNLCSLKNGPGTLVSDNDAHSGTIAATLVGVTSATGTITCDANYSGGGGWTCLPNGTSAGSWTGDGGEAECTIATPGSQGYSSYYCNGGTNTVSVAWRYQYMDCNGIWGPLGVVNTKAFSYGTDTFSCPHWWGSDSGHERVRRVRVNPNDHNQGCIIQEAAGSVPEYTARESDWVTECNANGGVVDDLAAIYQQDADGVVIRGACIECPAGQSSSAGGMCAAVACTNLTPPNSVTALSGTAGQTATVTCNSGYAAGGSATATWTCGANADHSAGTWTGDACVAVACTNTAKPHGYTVETGVAYYGNDLPSGPHLTSGTIHDCANACEVEPNCTHWTWGSGDGDNCYLKMGVGEPSTISARTSGIKLGNLTGVTGDTHAVTCADGHEGGGTWTCEANGATAGSWVGGTDCASCSGTTYSTGGADCQTRTSCGSGQGNNNGSTTLAGSCSPCEYVTYVDKDHADKDLAWGTYHPDDIDGCHTECLRNTSCTHFLWSHNDGHCWLKYGIFTTGMLTDLAGHTVGTRGAYSSADDTSACVAKTTCAGAGSGAGYHEDFNSGFSNWTASSGDWESYTGQRGSPAVSYTAVRNVNNSGTAFGGEDVWGPNMYLSGPNGVPSIKDVTLTVDAYSTDNDGFGFFVRYDPDSGDRYRLSFIPEQWGSGVAKLYKGAPNSTNVIDSAETGGMVMGQWTMVTFSFIGDDYTVIVDGNVIMSGTDSYSLAGGTVGLYTSFNDALYVDNLTVAGESSQNDADLSCTTCGSNTFAATNSLVCEAWATCDPGQEINSAGDISQDRTCSACGNGEYSNTSNAASCTACGSGTWHASGNGQTSCGGTWANCESYETLTGASTTSAGTCPNVGNCSAPGIAASSHTGSFTVAAGAPNAATVTCSAGYEDLLIYSGDVRDRTSGDYNGVAYAGMGYNKWGGDDSTGTQTIFVNSSHDETKYAAYGPYTIGQPAQEYTCAFEIKLQSNDGQVVGDWNNELVYMDMFDNAVRSARFIRRFDLVPGEFKWFYLKGAKATGITTPLECRIKRGSNLLSGDEFRIRGIKVFRHDAGGGALTCSDDGNTISGAITSSLTCDYNTCAPFQMAHTRGRDHDDDDITGITGDVVSIACDDSHPGTCTVATPGTQSYAWYSCDGAGTSVDVALRYQYMDCNGIWGYLGAVYTRNWNAGYGSGYTCPHWGGSESGHERVRRFRVNPNNHNQGCIVQESAGAVGSWTALTSDWSGDCNNNHGGYSNNLEGTYHMSETGVTQTCGANGNWTGDVCGQ